jgi:hypothetical protein
MIRIRRNLNVALAGLAVSALLAGAEKKIVINEGDEVYTATLDDTKAPRRTGPRALCNAQKLGHRRL